MLYLQREAPGDGVVHTTHTVTVAALAAVLLTLITVSTVLRMYTKLAITKSQGWEDYTMCLAWALLVAYITIAIQPARYGAGRHVWELTTHELEQFMMWTYVTELAYVPLIAMARLSICLQLKRIFIVNRNAVWWAAQIFIWINMAWYFTGIFRASLQCIPPKSFWDHSIEGFCLPVDRFIVATGTWNCTADLIMLLFPIVCVWHLQMQKRRKAAYFVVFILGSFTVVAAAIRVSFSVQNLESDDLTFTVSRVGYCTVGEVAAGVLAGNLVVFPRFLESVSPAIARLLSGYLSRVSDGTVSSKSSSGITRPNQNFNGPDATSHCSDPALNIVDSEKLTRRQGSDPVIEMRVAPV